MDAMLDSVALDRSAPHAVHSSDMNLKDDSVMTHAGEQDWNVSSANRLIPPMDNEGLVANTRCTKHEEEEDDNGDLATTIVRRPQSRKRPNSNLSLVENQPSSLTKKSKGKESVSSKSDGTATVENANKDISDNPMSWICMECKEAEAVLDVDSDLVLCEGSCNRPFHLVCVGLKTIPADDWKCVDCVTQRHVCSICQEYGVNNVDVFLCKTKGCGMFYHESCLSMMHIEINHVQRGGGENGGQLTGSTGITNNQSDHTERPSETIPEFRCPAHRCWTCTEDIIIKDDDTSDKNEVLLKRGRSKGRKKRRKPRDNVFGVKTGQLFKCLECCTAYHVSCLSPFAKFHELALLCHEHAASHKLPYLDMETSFQSQIEKAVDKKLETLDTRKRGNGTRSLAKVEENKFFLGLQGDVISREEATLLTHVEAYAEKKDGVFVPAPLLELLFCLPCDLKDEVYSKPPHFRMVQSLRYDPNNRPRRREPAEESCKCKDAGYCDEHCYNRIMCMECTGDSSKANGTKNPYWNCDVGTHCGNRSLGLRQAAKCKPQREQGKGWGLIALEALKKGDLVQEYVGEVIDEKAKEDRLTSWTKDHPNDPNFYIMQLDAGWYIDARVEANLSRFINHSCEPNCILRPVSVAGYTRNGIYAARDIAPGEFLSYDYRFDTKHGDKFVCRCGSDHCRGTMKGGKQLSEQDDAQRTLKQALAEAKMREEKDRKYLEDSQRIKDANFSQVDFLVPGAENPGESVALGPHARRRYEEIRHRIFLWRNSVAGANFCNRSLRLDAHGKRRKQREPPTQIDVLTALVKLKTP